MLFSLESSNVSLSAFWRVILAGATVLAIGFVSVSGRAIAGSKQVALSGAGASQVDRRGLPASHRALIEPGLRIGALKLGDTRARALRLFPRKAASDQEWEDSCGVTYNWVDIAGKVGRGNVFIR